VPYGTNKCAKCHYLAWKPARTLGWKASAALAALISHPSLILSATHGARLPRGSVLLPHRAGPGLWVWRSCECSDGRSCSKRSPAAGWGRSLPGGRSMGSCKLSPRRRASHAAGNPWAMRRVLMWPSTEQRMGAPKVLTRTCPLEQKRVISEEGRACSCTCVLTSFVKTCAGGGLHVVTLETMAAATSVFIPSQRTDLTSSLAQDISAVALLKLAGIPPQG